jgi:hypothetical protein
MSEKPSQFEQENDLGRGGGEVDEATMDEAWREAERRRSTANEDGEHHRSNEEISEEERDRRSGGFGPVHEE